MSTTFAMLPQSVEAWKALEGRGVTTTKALPQRIKTKIKITTASTIEIEIQTKSNTS